jgi:transposase InsO family protein
VAEFPRYGYRRVTEQLQRQGNLVGRKLTARLQKEMGLQQPVKRRKRRTTNSNHNFPRYPNLVRDLIAQYPDHIWVADITYIRLKLEFVYLAVIMDVFTRSIRGWNLSRSLDQHLSIGALKQGLSNHCPTIHHSDQGLQYAASAYTDLLKPGDVKISMADVGCPEQNGYAERLMRTIKEEEVDLSEYEDFADARRQIGRFLEQVYMYKRIHSSLGYLTPVEFEELYRKKL